MSKTTRIFLGAPFEKPRRLGALEATWRWDGEVLELTRHGMTQVTLETPGAYLTVSRGEDGLVLTPVLVPKQDGDLLMWTIGVPREARTFTPTVFGERAARRRKALDWKHYTETKQGSVEEGWCIITCRRPSGAWDWVAVYANPRWMDRQMVNGMLHAVRIVHPRGFIEPLLRERLYVSDADLEGLRYEEK